MGRKAKLPPLTEDQMLTQNGVIIDQLYSRLDAIYEALPVHQELFRRIEQENPLDTEILEIKDYPEGFPKLAKGVKLMYTGRKLVVFKNRGLD